MRLSIILIFLLGATSISSAQQYVVQGCIKDTVREIPINGASIIVIGDAGIRFETTSDSLGIYTLKFNQNRSSERFIITVETDGYLSDARKLEFTTDSVVQFDFSLRPTIICIDNFLPVHFRFDSNSSAFNKDDSLAVVMRFSNIEIKNMLLNYSYHIIARRSTEELNQIAFDRSNALRNLLQQQGIDSENITLEDKSNEDFFYCQYCDGCVYEFQQGQGVHVTQELIDQTNDTTKKAEYEAMRRICQVEMKRLED